MKNFITTWKTDNSGVLDDNRISLGVSSSKGYDYMIDWGDGQVDNGVEGSTTHKYDSAGTYTVEISGAFPQLFFDSASAYNNQKLLSVEQWGDIEWQSMQRAFYNCTNLVVNATDVPDLSRVTDMSLMFKNAHAFNSDISGWDVSSVTKMGWMFNNARAFNQNIGRWDVSAVTEMDWMFSEAHAFNQDISGWDVSAVTKMNWMFCGAEAFNQDIGRWDVGLVKDITYMFRRACAFSHYDALLVGWSTRNLQNNVRLDMNLKYSSESQSARDVLTEMFNWTIIDGGVAN